MATAIDTIILLLLLIQSYCYCYWYNHFSTAVDTVILLLLLIQSYSNLQACIHSILLCAWRSSLYASATDYHGYCYWYNHTQISRISVVGQEKVSAAKNLCIPAWPWVWFPASAKFEGICKSLVTQTAVYLTVNVKMCPAERPRYKQPSIER